MMMDGKSRILWITRTAIFIALLIVLQAATAPLGNTLVTGSIVNLVLVVAVMTCGLVSGLSVAVVSPVVAKLFGIGPLWSLIPFIALGNAVLAVMWHFVGNRRTDRKYVVAAVAVVCAAVAKFLTLYIGIVLIAIPFLLKLPAPQAAVIGNMFSIPQLFTALVGGAIAAILLPTVKKAVGERSK